MDKIENKVAKLIKRLEIEILYKHEKSHMGDVYIGNHKYYGEVILKVLADRLRSNPIFHKRWEREVYATKILSKHTSIPPILTYGEQPFPWFVQRFVGRVTLGEFLSNQVYPLDAMGQIITIRVLNELVNIINTSSQLGFIHRDIRPDNIVLNDKVQPYLIDWGLVSFTNLRESNSLKTEDIGFIKSSFCERLTEPWRCHGVVGYIAPEQATAFYDNAGIKNEMYSLAVIAIEALSGDSPFTDIQDEAQVLEIQRGVSGPRDLEALHSQIWNIFDDQLHSFLLADPKKRNTDIEQFRRILLRTLPADADLRYLDNR